MILNFGSKPRNGGEDIGGHMEDMEALTISQTHLLNI